MFCSERSALKYIFCSIKKHDASLISIIVLANITLVFSTVTPIIFPRYILDSLINGEQYSVVISYVLVFAITAIGFSLATYFLRRQLYLRSMTLRFKVQVESGKKFASVKYENLESPQFYELSALADRATANNVEGIEGILHRLVSFGGNIFTVCLIIPTILPITPIPICVGMLSITLLAFVSDRQNKREKTIRDEQIPVDRKWGYILNVLSDIKYHKEIIMFSLKKIIMQHIDRYASIKNENESNIQRKRSCTGNILSGLTTFFNLSTYVAIGLLVLNGILTIGEYVMYTTAMLTFFRLARTIVDDALFIRIQSEYVNDFIRYMEADNVNKDEINTISRSTKDTNKDNVFVRFENVSYKYSNQNDYVLKDVSFSIMQNEKIALVGHNGAGKSTIIKLISGLYFPSKGAVYINNIILTDNSVEEIQKIVSPVFQETNLLAFSLAENISMQPITKTDAEKVNDIIKNVGLKEVVERLELGLKTSMLKIIDEKGVDFSGGERQKVSLARALYKDSQLLILDEPAASLDALSEAELYKSFNEVAKDKTVIYVSHRLASTLFCDRIMVVDNGQIVECGTHTELMALGGVYAGLFKMQAKLYKEGVQ